jgi:hypothetical protein
MSKIFVDTIEGKTGNTIAISDSVSALKTGTIQSAGGTTAMSIDSSGRVTKPVLPCANVSFTSGTLAANTANTDAVMICNVANLNQGSHYNTSNGKFTCPVAGIYQVTAYTMDGNSSAGGAVYLRVKVSGTTNGTDAGSYTASNSHAGAHISKLVSCTAGQELTVTYYSTSGLTAGYTGATFMLVG